MKEFCVKFHQNRLKIATVRERTQTHIQIDRQTEMTGVICPMLYHTNGTEKDDTGLRIFCCVIYSRNIYEEGLLSHIQKCQNGLVPTYLCDDVRRPADTQAKRRLRSASSTSLDVQRTRLSTVRDRAFPVAAARL